MSTIDQNPNRQTDALEAAGCEKLFSDTASGVETKRKGLDRAIAELADGDTLVVWKLSRLGRSARHLHEVVEDLQSKGVSFVSLTEGFDTSTAAGKVVFTMIAAFAEFERELIRERTLSAGLSAARARGVKLAV